MRQDMLSSVLGPLRDGRSWFDVVACALDELRKTIGAGEAAEATFLGRFYGEGGEESRNPNLASLRDFETVVRNLVARELAEPATTSDVRQGVADALAAIALVPYGTSKDENDATLLWTLVKGIDRACQSSAAFGRLRKRGPLNKEHPELGVYFAPCAHALSKQLADAGLAGIPRLMFNDQLHGLMVYWPPHEPCPPHASPRLPRVVLVPRASDDVVDLANLADPVDPVARVLDAATMTSEVIASLSVDATRILGFPTLGDGRLAVPSPVSPSPADDLALRPLSSPDVGDAPALTVASVSAMTAASASAPTTANPSQQPEIRIGLELFSGASIHGWDDGEGGADVPLAFVHGDGITFHARYASTYVDIFGRLVCDSLDEAMERGCQIVVFPEYVVAPALVDVMRRHLADPSRRNRLRLVVAGSGWEGGARGNNVCVVLDGAGNIVGRTYKTSPYTKYERANTPAAERASDLAGEPSDGPEKVPAEGGSADGPEKVPVEYVPLRGLVEDLGDPGAERVVVDVEGVGRVLPAICKDLVSDERCAFGLAHAFGAHVVCAPAMSASLRKAFDDQLGSLAVRDLVVGCVCNLCAARGDFDRPGHDAAADDAAARGAGTDDAGTDVSVVYVPGHAGGAGHAPRVERCCVTRSKTCRPACRHAFEQGRPRHCLWVAHVEACSSGDGLAVRLDAPAHRV